MHDDQTRISDNDDHRKDEQDVLEYSFLLFDSFFHA